MSEPVLQVKGLKPTIIPKRASSPQWTDWISRWSRAKRLPSSAKAAAASCDLAVHPAPDSPPPGKIIDGEIIYHGQDLVKSRSAKCAASAAMTSR